MKGWGKTKLIEGFDFDEYMLDQDAEEEFLLQIAMAELNLNSDDFSDDSSDDEIELVLVPVSESKKEKKQSQITDFFSSEQ